MATQRYEIEAWLGPVLAELTADEVAAVQAKADDLADRLPGEDNAEQREYELSRFVRQLLNVV